MFNIVLKFMVYQMESGNFTVTLRTPENFPVITKWKLENLQFPFRKPYTFRFPFDPESSRNSSLRDNFLDHFIS